MVEIKNLRFGYKSKPHLFEGLSLSLPAGSVVGLLGRNGEGKSTLMKLMAGLLLGKGGEASVLGRACGERSLQLLQSVYMLGEEVRLPDLRIEQYLSLYGAFYPTYKEHIATELLELFELSPKMKLGQMSLGQKKKAQIALALALQTPLLLLDEPTNGLDIPSKSVFRRALVKYSHPEQTIIISTHQVRDLEQCIDHLLLMHDNCIVCNEPIARLEDCFASGALTEPVGGCVLYREPSVLGDVGLWSRSKEDEGLPCSIELFFNAMTSATEVMISALEAYKAEHPHETSEHREWLSE